MTLDNHMILEAVLALAPERQKGHHVTNQDMTPLCRALDAEPKDHEGTDQRGRRGDVTSSAGCLGIRQACRLGRAILTVMARSGQPGSARPGR
jgi:hypothetical protein